MIHLKYSNAITALKQYYSTLSWFWRLFFPRQLKQALTDNASPTILIQAALDHTWFFQRWILQGLRAFLQSEVILAYQNDAETRIKLNNIRILNIPSLKIPTLPTLNIPMINLNHLTVDLTPAITHWTAPSLAERFSRGDFDRYYDTLIPRQPPPQPTATASPNTDFQRSANNTESSRQDSSPAEEAPLTNHPFFNTSFAEANPIQPIDIDQRTPSPHE